MGNRIKNFLAIVACTVFIPAMAAAGAANSFGTQQTSAPAQSSISLPSRISPKAQELLNHAIQALGGPAFLNFKNISTSGRVFGFSNDQMAGVYPFKSIDEPPDKRRFTYGKGKPVTLINNGKEAWELDQYGLVHQLPEKVRQWKIANRYSVSNLLRVIIKESGVLILDHGVDFVANQPAYVIDIIDSQNVHIRLYLRKSNYLPLRVTYSIQNPTTQDRDEYIDDYSDYQSFDGVMTPMNILRRLNGERIGAVYRNKASYNVSVPANYFQPPR
ncbi:MAG: outer membrane lipoprotein-sorting protein [Acidobacteria bacterium]|nr:outer membrane lipoprotein-sorting protein [Acidobacteriota bacterium]